MVNEVNEVSKSDLVDGKNHEAHSVGQVGKVVYVDGVFSKGRQSQRCLKTRSTLEVTRPAKST